MLFVSAKKSHAEFIFAKLGTTLSSEHPTSQALFYLQEEITRSLAGQMHIQIFSEAQLGSADEILEGLQFGDIEIGVIPSELLVSCSPLFAAVSMPYIFRDNEHRFRVLDGPVGMQLLSSLKQHNLIGLGFLDTGMRNVLSRRTQLGKPEELQGQKIGLIRRCSGEDCQNPISGLVEQSLVALGALPEPIKQEDVYLSLQSEIISGLECSLAEILSFKLYELDSIYFSSGMYYSVPDVLVVSKRWFDTLSPQIQDMLWDASRITVKQQRKLWTEHAQETISILETKGVIIEMADQEMFRNAVQSIYKKMYEEFGLEFEKLIQGMMAVK